jgi:hypothetical protein
MSQPQRTKIQALLSADASPLREELLGLVFDAVTAQPTSVLLADPGLVPLIYKALNRENAQRIATRHVLPGISRVDVGLQRSTAKIGDALSPQAQGELKAVVASGKGPRFLWLKGAVDPNDVRLLVAPVVQQVLLQFTTKLPIPGLAGSGGGQGGGGGSGALGGLVGMLGKQVQKSAGQLADVGKSVMSNLGADFERRMQHMARDFTQTAIVEFRTAMTARLKSEEGKQIVARIRDRVVEHIVQARLGDASKDLMHLPVLDIAALVVSVIDHLPSQPWFRELFETEVRSVLEEIGKRSLAELLEEHGLLAEARALTLTAVAPGVKALAASDAFGDWLERLLAQSSAP